MVKTKFGAKRPLLISPHGGSDYNSLWHGQVVVPPPNWNSLALQHKVNHVKTNEPKLRSAFGKKKKSSSSSKRKPTKALRKMAKKYGVRLTSKKNGKRIYKSSDQIKKEMKSLKKNVKKPSKKVLKTAKKLGIKVTVKRGKKRVYKSEKVLQKQIKQKLKVEFNKKRKTLQKNIKNKSTKRRHRIVKKRVKARGYLNELKAKVAHKRAMRAIAARKRYSGPKLKSDFGMSRINKFF